MDYKFSQEQKMAIEAMASGKNIFISGPGGTGKSYLIKALEKKAHSLGKNIVKCAPTASAAKQIGAVTIHRMLKLPPRVLLPADVFDVPDTILHADIIVIDEISMVRFDVFYHISKIIFSGNHLLQESENKKAFSEGRCPKTISPKQLVVIGDFCQLPPVVTDEDRYYLQLAWGYVGNGFAFQTPIWKSWNFVPILLSKIMRQNDVEFLRRLNELRLGKKGCVEWFNECSNSEVVDGIYLCSKRKQVQQINFAEMNKLQTPAITFQMVQKYDVKSEDLVVPQEIDMKIGMKVIIVSNDPERRYCNGDIGCVVGIDLERYCVIVDVRGQKVEIVPAMWQVFDYEVVVHETGALQLKQKMVGYYIQIPILPAYAITIHRSQGMTYDGSNIHPDTFAPGQLYVALSRVRTISGIHLLSKIRAKDLIIAPEVVDFYNAVEEEFYEIMTAYNEYHITVV